MQQGNNLLYKAMFGMIPLSPVLSSRRKHVKADEVSRPLVLTITQPNFIHMLQGFRKAGGLVRCLQSNHQMLV